MVKVLLVLVLAGFVFAEDVVVDINRDVDLGLKSTNFNLRRQGMTTMGIPGHSLGEKIHFSSGVIMGLDSLVRTQNCSYIISPKYLTFSYDYHIGLSKLLVKLDEFQYDTEELNQTIVVGIKDNSVHYKFTAFTEYECKIVLDDLSVESFRDIEVKESTVKYDKDKVETFFQTVVLQEVNKLIKKEAWPRVQNILTSSCSRNETKQHNGMFEQLLKPLLTF